MANYPYQRDKLIRTGSIGGSGKWYTIKESLTHALMRGQRVVLARGCGHNETFTDPHRIEGIDISICRQCQGRSDYFRWPEHNYFAGQWISGDWSREIEGTWDMDYFDRKKEEATVPLTTGAIVLKIGQDGRLYNSDSGRRVFDTIDEATAAARELAARTSETFYVFAAVASVSPQTPPTLVKAIRTLKKKA